MKQQSGRNPHTSTDWQILLAAVLFHFLVTSVHGFAHTRAKVVMSNAALGFVFCVILVGPILGIIVQRIALPRGGAWAIAGMMITALVYGLANHFLIPGSDHVNNVDKPWHALFSMTAALLVPAEAFGAAVAIWCAMRAGRQS